VNILLGNVGFIQFSKPTYRMLATHLYLCLHSIDHAQLTGQTQDGADGHILEVCAHWRTLESIRRAELRRDGIYSAFPVTSIMIKITLFCVPWWLILLAVS
jgi:hypothetical protein